MSKEKKVYGIHDSLFQEIYPPAVIENCQLRKILSSSTLLLPSAKLMEGKERRVVCALYFSTYLFYINSVLLTSTKLYIVRFLFLENAMWMGKYKRNMVIKLVCCLEGFSLLLMVEIVEISSWCILYMYVYTYVWFFHFCRYFQLFITSYSCWWMFY